MADIRIEKKKPVWPWIIIIIIIIITVFLYLYGSADTETTDDLDDAEMEEVTYTGPVMILHEKEGEFN